MYSNLHQIELQPLQVDLVNPKRQLPFQNQLNFYFEAFDDQIYLVAKSNFDPYYIKHLNISKDIIDQLIIEAVGTPEEKDRKTYCDLDQTQAWLDFCKPIYDEFSYHLLSHGLIMKNHNYFGFSLFKTRKKNTAYFSSCFKDKSIYLRGIYKDQAAEKQPERIVLYIPYCIENQIYYALFEVIYKPNEPMSQHQQTFELAYQKIEFIESNTMQPYMLSLIAKFEDRIEKEYLYDDPEDANQLSGLYLQFFQPSKKSNRFNDLF